MDRSPFHVCITVLFAANLPVADLTTSDPFVSLLIGGVEVGRTTTKYKNHRRPEWNEAFRCALLHTQQTLELRIFDDDRMAYKDHDLLGTVSIDLSLLPINNPARTSYKVVSAGAYKANATIDVELCIERNCHLVSLLSQHAKVLRKHESVNDMSFEPVNDLKSLALWKQAPRSVHSAFLEMAANDETNYSSKDVLVDLLYDVCTLDPTLQVSAPEQTSIIQRKSDNSGGSGWISLENPFVTGRSLPTDPSTLRIHFHPHVDNSITLTFPSTSAAWVWLKWLQAAFDIWTQSTPRLRWPTWMSQAPFYGRLREPKGKLHHVERKSGGRAVQGEGLILDVEKPFMLVATGRAYGLHRMTAITIGRVGEPPKSYSLEMELVRIENVRAYEGRDGEKGSHSASASASASSHQHQPSKQAPSSKAKPSPLFSLPFSALTGTRPAAAPQSTALELTVRYSSLVHEFPSDVSMIVDFQMSELMASDRFFGTDTSDEPRHVDGVPALVPSKNSRHASQTIDLYFTQGEQIVGEKSCKLHSLLPSSLTKKRMTAVELVTSPLFSTNEWSEVTLALDSKIEVEVKLLGASIFPASLLADLPSQSTPHSVVVKAVLVDSNGVAVSTPRKSSVLKLHKNALELPPSTSVVFPFQSTDRLHQASSLCLELCLERTMRSLGQCFVPVDYFSPKEEVYSFAMVNSTSSLAHLGDGHEVGEWILALKKTVHTIDLDIPNGVNANSLDGEVTDRGFPQVRLRCRFFENNIVNNTWYGETILLPPNLSSSAASKTTGNSASNGDSTSYYDLSSYPAQKWTVDLSPTGLFLLPLSSASVASGMLCTHGLEMSREGGRHGDVCIPWRQVGDVLILSPSLVCIHFQYHCAESHADGRHATSKAPETSSTGRCDGTAELYVYNVFARELQALVEERKMFDHYRVIFHDLAVSRSILGQSNTVLCTTSNDSVQEDCTTTTSQAASLLESLHTTILDVQQALQNLQHSQKQQAISPHSQQSLKKEQRVLTRRLLRLQLYKSRLYSLNLQASMTHHLANYDLSDEQQLRLMVEMDIYRIYSYECEDRLSTANNRIQCLLDVAARRVYDVALVGWKAFHGDCEEDDGNGGNEEAGLAPHTEQRSSSYSNATTRPPATTTTPSNVTNPPRQLIRCFEIVCNGYYTEMVNILTAIFNNTADSEIKGLKNKLLLLHTFMSHDDRMHRIIVAGFQPYHLTPSGPLTLSSFVNVNILLTWYQAELVEEMKIRVDQVLAVWKDAERNASDNVQAYQYPLPWYPYQRPIQPMIFYTNITKDTVDLLVHYVQHAKLNKQDISMSYAHDLDRLDTKVCLAYIHALAYLAQHYLDALQEKDHPISHTHSLPPLPSQGLPPAPVHSLPHQQRGLESMSTEEFNEYTTFLFSVVNDMQRIHADDALGLQALPLDQFAVCQAEEVKQQQRRMLWLFEEVRWQALDQLSCMIFLYALEPHERSMLQQPAKLLESYTSSQSSPMPPLSYIPSSAQASGTQAGAMEDGVVGAEGGSDFFQSLWKKIYQGLEDSQDFLEPSGFALLSNMCWLKIVIVWCGLVKVASENEGRMDGGSQEAGSKGSGLGDLAKKLWKDAKWLLKQIASDLQDHAEGTSVMPEEPSPVWWEAAIASSSSVHDSRHASSPCFIRGVTFLTHLATLLHDQSSPADLDHALLQLLQELHPSTPSPSHPIVPDEAKRAYVYACQACLQLRGFSVQVLLSPLSSSLSTAGNGGKPCSLPIGPAKEGFPAILSEAKKTRGNIEGLSLIQGTKQALKMLPFSRVARRWGRGRDEETARANLDSRMAYPANGDTGDDAEEETPFSSLIRTGTEDNQRIVKEALQATFANTLEFMLQEHASPVQKIQKRKQHHSAVWLHHPVTLVFGYCASHAAPTAGPSYATPGTVIANVAGGIHGLLPALPFMPHAASLSSLSASAYLDTLLVSPYTQYQPKTRHLGAPPHRGSFYTNADAGRSTAPASSSLPASASTPSTTSSFLPFQVNLPLLGKLPAALSAASHSSSSMPAASSSNAVSMTRVVDEDDYSQQSVMADIRNVVNKAIRRIDRKIGMKGDRPRPLSFRPRQPMDEELEDATYNNVAIDSQQLALPDILLVFKDLKVSNLFYLSVIHPPKPYLKIRCGRRTKETRDRPLCTSADWTNEDIAMPIYVQEWFSTGASGGNNASSSTNNGAGGNAATAMSSVSAVDTRGIEVKIMLYYKGVRHDHLVGMVRIPIDLHGLEAFENRNYVISEFSSEAQSAAAKAKREGRGGPVITFSMWPSNLM